MFTRMTFRLGTKLSSSILIFCNFLNCKQTNKQTNKYIFNFYTIKKEFSFYIREQKFKLEENAKGPTLLPLSSFPL